MKINQSNSNINQNPILINTLVKQVSDLQIDTSEIKSDLTDLETAVNTHITFNRDGDGRTEVNNLASNNALISNANIQHANITDLSSATGTIGDLTSTNGTITNIDSENADINTADIGTLNVSSASNLKRTTVDGALTVSGLTTTEDIHAKDIESISIHTADVETTALTAVSGNISTVNSQNITASNKITTKDLEVTGDITGVSDIEMHDLIANEIKANTADIDKITWIEQILDNTHVIDPSPELGNNDRYTIQLPKFAGWYIITCLGESNIIKWAATVRGNGYDYSVSWSCDDIEESIKNFYQYNGQLYIRHATNGTIAFAYSADRELPDPTIYFNMDGWTQDKDLPELCDENYQYDVINLSGTLFFGLLVAPKLQGGSGSGAINFKGSCMISDLAVKLRDPETNVGDVWNILDYGYTTSDFVEGAGRPINIDDDVVAVESEVEDLEVSDLGENDGYKWPFFNNAHWSLVENWIGTPGGVVKTELDGTETTYPLDIDIRPVRDSKLIKGTNCLLFVTNEAIVRSEDGENWTKVADLHGMGHDLQSDIIKLHNGTLLCIYHYGYDEGCQKAISTDDGLTWDITDYPAIDDFMPSYLLSDTNSVYAYRGTAKLWISNDNGNTFSEITTADSSNYHEYGNTIISIDKGIRKVYMLNKSTMTWETHSWTGDPYKIIDVINMNGPAILKVDENADRTVDLLITYDFSNSWKKLGSLNLSNSPSMYHVINNKIIYDNRSVITYFSGKALRWDKFAAGVNYEDFVADKITANNALISKGTLEVDGTSEFKDDVTVTGNIYQTGNINQTGNIITDGNVEANQLFGKRLGINDSGSATSTNTYFSVASTGIDAEVDITHNGNLTRTGNETVIGVVTIGDLL